MSKKIAHLSSVHKDGDVRIFHKMCSSLAENGYEVHLVLAGVQERVEKDVKIWSVEKAKGRLSRFWNTVNNVYDKAVEIDADIYHIHDPELLRIGKKLIKKGKKVIYDSHEDLPRQIMGKPYLKFRKIVSLWAEGYENRATKKMTAIVGATPHITNRFSKINSNSVNINNYPILTEFNMENSDTKRTDICYAGGITEIRGIHEIVSIADGSFPLVLAGPIGSGKLEEEITNHSNWKNIDYKGQVSRVEVKTIYSKSLAGLVILHPIEAHKTAQPNKIFEYMNAGIAVIGSNFDLWKEIIEDGSCGICVDPLKPEEIKNAIEQLLSDPKEAEKMGQNGQRLVKEKYNWDNEKEKLLKLYATLT